MGWDLSVSMEDTDYETYAHGIMVWWESLSRHLGRWTSGSSGESVRGDRVAFNILLPYFPLVPLPFHLRRGYSLLVVQPMSQNADRPTGSADHTRTSSLAVTSFSSSPMLMGIHKWDSD